MNRTKPEPPLVLHDARKLGLHELEQRLAELPKLEDLYGKEWDDKQWWWRNQDRITGMVWHARKETHGRKHRNRTR